MERFKVLIVDDSRDSRRLMTATLSPRGYSVMEASSGREALSLLAQDSAIRLVILDLGLPDLDGFSVLKALRKGQLPVQVCVVSARRDRESVLKAVQLGCSDYLVKPVYGEALLAKVSLLLGQERPTPDYHPIKSMLQVNLSDSSVRPVMFAIEITEEGLTISCSAEIDDGTILELESPGFKRKISGIDKFHCRVTECTKHGQAKYVIKAEFVGMPGEVVSRIRSLGIQGRFIADS